ncbi:hypothetical protein LMG27177_02018 [Paraburkholderia fynbosensis]|uniref:Uncharacterized protein n=1 Tax=Paraburkholderia fynbosensis TaxID=1200993 RepID=A0A6J5FSJ0_9BURK|nr:hypothetical protein [Paraburkholderia fynbosensis]CAB3786489.1 hypothetical protein LMG27177_02018 [Paraburkholderia fynbosensis]
MEAHQLPTSTSSELKCLPSAASMSSSCILFLDAEIGNLHGMQLEATSHHDVRRLQLAVLDANTMNGSNTLFHVMKNLRHEERHGVLSLRAVLSSSSLVLTAQVVLRLRRSQRLRWLQFR